MPPYTDLPQMQVPMGASPGSLPTSAYQPSPAYVQVQEINGVTYFMPQVPMQVPAHFSSAHKNASSGQSMVNAIPVQAIGVYQNESGSSGCNSPVPAGQQLVSSGYSSPVCEESQTQPCEHFQGSPTQEVYRPAHISPVTQTMSYLVPQNTSTQQAYTTAPSQPILIPQPQIIQYVPLHATPPQPVYHFQPIQEYSPANSVQYSPSSPAFTAHSTPVGGHSPAPSSATGSRASTPRSGAGESLSTRLEVVWHGHFNGLFKNYPDKWVLEPIEDPRALRSDGVQKYMDSAKVRFICPTCGNCWTSMKGRVYFLYILDPIAKHGFVYFKLFGQKCSKCSSEEYVHSMWYRDEIEKVVENIHQKVGQTYYGITTPIVRVDRRRGQPKKPHPLVSCQACDMGICREEHNFR